MVNSSSLICARLSPRTDSLKTQKAATLMYIIGVGLRKKNESFSLVSIL